jgi:signal transduction histidine kinase
MAANLDNPPIQLLVVEDSEMDYDLLLALLARSGRPVRARRVEDEAGMRAVLADGPVDIVISDHNLPSFDSLAALAVARAHDPDLPVIVVSGEMSEELAVGVLQAGADDFILKSRLFRAGPAITRSLQAARERRAGRATASALEESESRLRALTRHLETVKEEERHRIAREIHDDIGATLTALRFELVGLARQQQTSPEQAPRLASMLSLLEQAVAASHRIQHNLRPPVLDAGLVAALQWLVRSFAARSSIAARFESNREDLPLPADCAAAMYRVVQESLANISKYAQAQNVSVQLFAAASDVTLEISDDGVGFDPGMLRATPGFGLRGLVERARGLGGWAEISSAPGRGTTVMFSVPMPGAAADAPPAGRSAARGPARAAAADAPAPAAAPAPPPAPAPAGEGFFAPGAPPE